MKRSPRNLPASVRARLLELSRQEGQTFQSVLVRYAIERLLYRLGESPDRGRFVLKGAQLFRVWFAVPARVTKDLDLAGHGVGAGDLIAMFGHIAALEVVADGVTFDPDTVRAEPIRLDQEYQGTRLHLQCRLEQARLDVQVDVGFGDALVPPPDEVAFPTLLDFPAPRLRAYTKEGTIAEKLHAMVRLGERNSRTKDFHDVWLIACRSGFEGDRLRRAIAATFERRRTAVPSHVPALLTRPDDAEPAARWASFSRRLALPAEATWPQVCALLCQFLGPPLQAVAAGQAFDETWPAGGPWAP